MLNPPRTWRPRLTLAHLLLLTTTIAIAVAYYSTHQKLATMRTAVRNMRQLTRELIVDNSYEIAAIERVPTLPHENIFDIYIPSVGKTTAGHELRLALDGIVGFETGANGFPLPQDQYPLTPGRHIVEIRHRKADSKNPESMHRIEILLDDQVVMEHTRSLGWVPADGWFSASSLTESRAFHPSQPAQLHRRRFQVPTLGGSPSSVPDGEPANGILLWIAPRSPSP
jgi:hypothetical protein